MANTARPEFRPGPGSMSLRAGRRAPLVTARRAGYALAAVVSATVLATAALVGYTVHRVAGSLNTSPVPGVGHSGDGSMNILLMGLDTRRALDGSDLPRDLLDTLHVGSSSDIGGYNTNVLILMHLPKNGGQPVAFSIPRDDWVPVRGEGTIKIKEAYGRAKAKAEPDWPPAG